MINQKKRKLMIESRETIRSITRSSANSYRAKVFLFPVGFVYYFLLTNYLTNSGYFFLTIIQLIIKEESGKKLLCRAGTNNENSDKSDFFIYGGFRFRGC